jgi:hypothetical protein
MTTGDDERRVTGTAMVTALPEHVPEGVRLAPTRLVSVVTGGEIDVCGANILVR